MDNRMLIGCCYYPEHWEDDALERDLAQIRDLGFNSIRMGEFSWSMYEKEEGKYDFSFLLKAVQAAERMGLDVILGTPTAAPPKWLIDRYPEVLCHTEDGKVLHHGSRQHHNHTSEVYLRCCAAITEAMLQAFCHCKNVIGWQIDNELNCHRNASYAPSDDLAFQHWLEKKYGTIEALNRAWGTRFWSLEFNCFAQIECPRTTTTHKNPSIMTDYFLFLSDTVVNFAAIQAKIIRKYMPNTFITHNGYFQNIDYKKLTDECLDVLSFDSYPAALERHLPFSGRDVEYRLAQTRGCSDRFLILEQQSGPGGQLSYLAPTPLPGQIRLWTYQSIVHGATGVLYFRYRTALYGAEQLWHGIYDHDGEENHRSREIRQITDELRRTAPIFLQHRSRAQVAIFSDYHNVCCNKAEPFFADDSRLIFRTLSHKNIHSDIIYCAEEMERYKVVIFPHISIANEALLERIEAFTAGGGIAILSARSGIKDENAHYRPLTYPGIFRSLAGCRVDWFSALPEYEKQSVDLNGNTYPINLYYEALLPEGSTPVATYTEGFCKGQPAAVRHGNVYYLGFYCKSNADIYYDLICRHISAPKLLDEHLEEISLGEYTMYLNHADHTIPFDGYDLLKDCPCTQIAPYDVILVKQGE